MVFTYTPKGIGSSQQPYLVSDCPPPPTDRSRDVRREEVKGQRSGSPETLSRCSLDVSSGSAWVWKQWTLSVVKVKVSSTKTSEVTGTNSTVGNDVTSASTVNVTSSSASGVSWSTSVFCASAASSGGGASAICDWYHWRLSSSVSRIPWQSGKTRSAQVSHRGWTM